MKERNNSRNKSIQITDNLFNYRNGSITNQSGEELFLEHRLRAFLKLLIDNKNEVVTREELMKSVWKDVIVSDESVTKAASDLRKFFKINGIENFELKTVPKLGYKLNIPEPIYIKTNSNSLLKKSLKVAGYVVSGFLFIIMLIRAINY